MAFLFAPCLPLYRRCWQTDLMQKRIPPALLGSVAASLVALIGSKTFSIVLMLLGGLLSLAASVVMIVFSVFCGKQFNDVYKRHLEAHAADPDAARSVAAVWKPVFVLCGIALGYSLILSLLAAL